MSDPDVTRLFESWGAQMGSRPFKMGVSNSKELLYGLFVSLKEVCNGELPFPDSDRFLGEILLSMQYPNCYVLRAVRTEADVDGHQREFYDVLHHSESVGEVYRFLMNLPPEERNCVEMRAVTSGWMIPI